VLAVLALSANTSFADFPRVCRLIAEKGYLPYPFTILGRRLVFSIGICVLALLSGLLLILFGGITDRLIPLFAVGAFSAFTLSQAGMVMHWKKREERRGSRRNMVINGVGAVATGLTTCVVVIAKFAEGAWIATLAIPGLVLLMSAIHRHYQKIESEIDTRSPAHLSGLTPPVVVVPMQSWSRVAEKALQLAYTVSQSVLVLHIRSEYESDTQADSALMQEWSEFIAHPAAKAGLTPPQLVVLPSPYRFVTSSIVEYILNLERLHPDRLISVVVPELVERRWFFDFLHNQRATLLKVKLYIKGNGHIVVTNVPWYLST